MFEYQQLQFRKTRKQKWLQTVHNRNRFQDRITSMSLNVTDNYSQLHILDLILLLMSYVLVHGISEYRVHVVCTYNEQAMNN